MQVAGLLLGIPVAPHHLQSALKPHLAVSLGSCTEAVHTSLAGWSLS